MLHDNMNISRLMIHTQHVEEAMAKRKIRDAKRARSFDCGSSKRSLEIQYKLRVKKRVYNHVSSKFPKSREYSVSNPKPKKVKDTSSPTEKPTVESVARSTIMIVLRGRTIVFGVV